MSHWSLWGRMMDAGIRNLSVFAACAGGDQPRVRQNRIYALRSFKVCQSPIWGEWINLLIFASFWESHDGFLLATMCYSSQVTRWLGGSVAGAQFGFAPNLNSIRERDHLTQSWLLSLIVGSCNNCWWRARCHLSINPPPHKVPLGKPLWSFSHFIPLAS